MKVTIEKDASGREIASCNGACIPERQSTSSVFLIRSNHMPRLPIQPSAADVETVSPSTGRDPGRVNNRKHSSLFGVYPLGSRSRVT